MAFALSPLPAIGGIALPALQSLMSGPVGEDRQGELQGVLASAQSLTSILGRRLERRSSLDQAVLHRGHLAGRRDALPAGDPAVVPVLPPGPRGRLNRPILRGISPNARGRRGRFGDAGYSEAWKTASKLVENPGLPGFARQIPGFCH